jgi:hypothetical protein
MNMDESGIAGVKIMEEGYRQLGLMIRQGENIDGVVKNAMNVVLCIMLAIENGELDPSTIVGHEFLNFERNKKATLEWLFERFVMWYRDCYPLHEEFLALDFFMDSIRYEMPNNVERDNEVRNILLAISFEMSDRKKKISRPQAGLIKDSVICVRQALSIEGAFIFFDQSYY